MWQVSFREHDLLRFAGCSLLNARFHNRFLWAWDIFQCWGTRLQRLLVPCFRVSRASIFSLVIMAVDRYFAVIFILFGGNLVQKGKIQHSSHLVLVLDLDGIQFVPFGFKFRYDLSFTQRRLYQLHSSGRSWFLSVLSFRSRVREEIRKYCPTFWYELCIFGNFQWKRIYLNRDSTELQSIMYEATQVNNDRRKWASRRRYKLATWHSLLVEQGRASSQPDVYSYTCMEIWSMRQVWRARKMFKSCGSNLLIQ